MEYQPINAAQFIKPVDDYLRVMTAGNEIRIADVPANVSTILTSYQIAKAAQAELVILPELCLTGYSTADLFFNQHVREQAVLGLEALADASESGPALAVGLPVEHNNRLYNCAALIAQGSIQGIVPKSFLPNYNEFYEKRWFTSGRTLRQQSIQIGNRVVPFGTDILFDINGTRVGIEICEDAWAAIAPSTLGGLNGADIYINLSASNEVIGKDIYRRQMISTMSGKVIQGYAYTSAGAGESNADVVYGGAQLIADNGRLVAERKAHDSSISHLVYDFDRTYLRHDRLQNKTFSDQADDLSAVYRIIQAVVPKPTGDDLARRIDAHPYVPSNPETLDKRCEEIFTNVASALAQKVRDANAESMVIGLSGGLDSLLTLFFSIEAAKLLGRPETIIRTVTMPGPASSDRTQDNASKLAAALNTTHKTIPIIDLTASVLTQIGHDGFTEDVSYQNTQARIRTLLLMNYANLSHGFVVGTGDMSEITQGWSTYNGDHMSMFNPNSGIPKTLVRHLSQWFVSNHLSAEAQRLGQAIVDTPVSPELVGNGDLSQLTEDQIGPYELHDFFDYHKERNGERPTKIGYLAKTAFDGAYDAVTIAKWLNSFLYRDTVNQWKTEAIPDGPKIGNVAKSPRGDRRMAPNTSPRWFN